METKSDIELFTGDYVIIKSNGEFLKHPDGRIVIYGDVMHATEDFKKVKGGKMWATTFLSARNRKALRKNIREFKNEK